MRTSALAVMAACVAFAVLAPAMSVTGYEAEIEVVNAAAPSVKALRPNGSIEVRVFLHDGGNPLAGVETDIYLLPPAKGAIPGAFGITTDENGWSNTTIAVQSRVAGDLALSVCDRSKGFGNGGTEGFHLAGDAIPLVGIVTERSHYRPGEMVVFTVVNDPELTNVTDPGAISMSPEGETSATAVGEGDWGAFALPADIVPGLYDLTSENGDLRGTFGVSDVTLFPRREVHPLGGTITVDTSLDGLTATIVSPDGEWLTYGVSGSTDIALPDEGAGDHMIIVDRSGVILLREHIHIAPCDLWAAADADVHLPGSKVRVHFAAVDIGNGLSGFSSFDFDYYYYDAEGEHTVSQTLQQASGVIVLDAPEEPLSGPYLWDAGEWHRIEMELNIGGETVRRSLPLCFGTGEILLDAPMVQGRAGLVVGLEVRALGTRPLWVLGTDDDTVSTGAPPFVLGVDPMGRTMARFDRSVNVLDDTSAVPETVTSPLGGMEVECSLDGGLDEATVVTDANGEATFWSRDRTAGTYWFEARAADRAEISARAPVTVSFPGMGFQVDGPDVVRAGEQVDLSISVLRDNATTAAAVNYRAVLEGRVLASGQTSDGDVSFVAPDADGEIVLHMSAAVDSDVLEGGHSIFVTSSGLFVALSGGAVAPGQSIVLSYAFAGEALEELRYSSAFGNGSLAGAAVPGVRGSIGMEVPSSWDGVDWIVSFEAYGDGRSAAFELALSRDATIDIEVTEEAGRLVFALDVELPDGAVLTSGLLIISSPDGEIVLTRPLEVLPDSDTKHFLMDPVRGAYTAEVSITFLTASGLRTQQRSGSYAHLAAEGDEEDGWSVEGLMPMLLMVLAVALMAVVFIAVGAMRRSSGLRRQVEEEKARRLKLKSRLARLEAMLPAEEGHIRDESEEARSDGETAVPDAAPEFKAPVREVKREPAARRPARHGAERRGGSEAAEAPCPMCGEKMFIPGQRPVTVRCAGCGFEFIVE